MMTSSGSSGFLQPPERTIGNPSRFYSRRSHGTPWMSRVVDGVNLSTPLTLNRANDLISPPGGAF